MVTACVASPEDFDFYTGQYYIEHSELADEAVPLVMPEHLVNAPVLCTKPKSVSRAGYNDKFLLLHIVKQKSNTAVVTNWAARFADATLREEGDEILLTKSQVSSRRITDRPGDEASRRNLLARGSTL